MSSELSATMREYLAQIYRLSERASHQAATSAASPSFVGTSALAELMDVSAPAVNRMVTKLKELGLLLHEPYQGISLTEEGIHEALIKLRKHRIAEAFLVKVMDFRWDEVYEEADRMSSAMSDSISQRMLEMAGHPRYCPHGEPIPEADGSLEVMDDLLLTEASPDANYYITRVLTREPDRLQYMAALGLVPGATLHVIHMAPFNGPMQLKLADEYRIIGHNLAEFIRVKAQ